MVVYYLFLELCIYEYSRKLWSEPVTDSISFYSYLPHIYFSWLMQTEKTRSQTLTGNLLPISSLFNAILCFYCIVTAHTASNFENNLKLLKCPLSPPSALIFSGNRGLNNSVQDMWYMLNNLVLLLFLNNYISLLLITSQLCFSFFKIILSSSNNY